MHSNLESVSQSVKEVELNIHEGAFYDFAEVAVCTSETKPSLACGNVKARSTKIALVIISRNNDINEAHYAYCADQHVGRL